MLRWLVEEVRSIAWLTLYFAACFIVIMVLEKLWLAEYGINFNGIPTALLAALITAKVVIVLDHVPLTKWLQGSPGIIEVVTRSAVYTVAVLAVMIVEKAFESRTEQGGLMLALTNIFAHSDMPRIWASTICVGLAFLAHNTLQIVRRAIGSKRMAELFLSRKAKITEP